MENLPMTLQLDNQFKRQYQILNMVHMNKVNQITINDLSDNLEKSKPTLKKDIEAINLALDAHCISLTIDQKGALSIQYKKALTIDTMITLLAKRTITYQLMDLLLHNVTYSTDELVTALMVSRSTIFKTIRHMNNILKEFNVTITTGPLTLSGSEEDIRFCFFAFYSSFGDSTIIDDDSELDAQYLVKEGHKRDLAFLHFSHFRAALWLSIAKARWKCKKFCNLNRRIKVLIKSSKGFSSLERLLQDYYVSRSNETLSLNETMWLYLISLHCISYTRQKNLDDGRSYAFYREENPNIIEAIHRFLTTVFPEKMIEDGSLEKMEAFLVNVRLLSKMSHTYELHSPTMMTQMKERHPEIYQVWYEKLTTLKNNPLFGFVHIDYIAAALTTFHASLLLKQSHRPLRILFTIQGPPSLDDYILNEIEALFMQRSTVEFQIEQAVTKESIETYQADLVVCNYDLHLIDEHTCQIHRISNIPTIADWRLLMETITYLSLPNYLESE
ncbi:MULTISPECIES: helix-turn-helix domain-containing protein [unclassified Enterococcus]|uniref:helix-turn-helix domain-containing protein n=1 Tax=unclassified Enterococcus TaxID=2608891 RepID=UPI001A92F564|nr:MULTISPECIES: helix-turn-helix domain-containing protein [unclassified Enterococcus]MBO0462024.1 helix-turn-helix domain-containing protein [Enterococcus sp. DIV1298c]MBO1300404.1 helix-turn-helix domain-containing protein [Enterococcus sp. DIV1271a]